MLGRMGFAAFLTAKSRHAVVLVLETETQTTMKEAFEAFDRNYREFAEGLASKGEEITFHDLLELVAEFNEAQSRFFERFEGGPLSGLKLPSMSVMGSQVPSLIAETSVPMWEAGLIKAIKFTNSLQNSENPATLDQLARFFERVQQKASDEGAGLVVMSAIAACRAVLKN